MVEETESAPKRDEDPDRTRAFDEPLSRATGRAPAPPWRAGGTPTTDPAPWRAAEGRPLRPEEPPPWRAGGEAQPRSAEPLPWLPPDQTPAVRPAPVAGPPVQAALATEGAIAPTIAPRAEPSKRPAVTVKRLRRGRLAVRKVDPFSVFKFSLVFYFCMLLIALLGLGIVFATLRAFGIIGNVEKLLRALEFDVTITGGAIFRWLFLLGIAGTLVASAVTTFMAFIYNLIADVVGGIELLVTERES
jgi:hypothetical protein